MFKRIVWATDGSDSADKALAVAKMLATESGGELLAVHCEELTLPGKGGGSLPVAANEEDLKSKIERQVAELSAEGIKATLESTRAKVGGAAHAIVSAAQVHESDAIVVGTRGHTPLGGLLVGSVTQRLLHIAPCPLIVVPTRDRDGHD
jgi:nucleotide-binding universal stress UspA family protein